MPTTRRALIEVLRKIPDFRRRWHPLGALLGLACVAMLCGYRSYSAIAEWGRNYGRALAQALGITQKKTPCAKTFHNVFRYLDRAAVEAKLGQWAEGVLAATPGPGGRTGPGWQSAVRQSSAQGCGGALTFGHQPTPGLELGAASGR